MAPTEQYYEQVNPDLLYRIPATSSAVLEVGCGSGALGRAFKSINPNTTYIGIELMAEPAAKARESLDYVIQCDISNHKITELPGGINQVDCLIFGDVLEHLIDPEATLRKLLQFLKNDGQVITCIPNVQHWTVLANLLSGQWPQEDQGLFDRTHLRWFTRQSIIDLMKAVELNIQDITPRIFGIEKAKSFVSTLQPSLNTLGIDSQQLLNNTSPLQYVTRASAKLTQKLEISGLMLKPQAGMNEVRMIQPLRSVASLPGVELQLSSSQLQLASAKSETPRIMIWQRQLLTYEDSIDRIKQVLRAGYILISEFDDDPDLWPSIKTNKYLNFTAVHAVQTSTHYLAEKLRTTNPEVAVYQNCLERMPTIDKDKWKGAGARKPLRIFFGALNRQNDWKEWIAALNRVIQNHQDKIEFEVVHDKAFFDQLQTPRKRFTPTCIYSKYIDRLRKSHISLLPLIENTFNQNKSDLKFVEAAGCQTTALASPTVYEEAIQNGTTGFICTSPEEMERRLVRLISNPEECEHIAKSAQLWCMNNRLQFAQSQQRLLWYMSLWKKRSELTRLLLDRVPELRDYVSTK